MLLSASCSPRPEQMLMDEAASLMMEYPDSAYLLLQSIASSSFPQGSELEARYALLYTQAQYKCYADIPSDSLISVAVDYYEANDRETDRFYAYLYQGIVRHQVGDLSGAMTSLMRAMSNDESIEDSYALGQMYLNLSSVISANNCSDEELFARKAAEEYGKGGLDVYRLNALTKVAVAQHRQGRLESCRSVIDSVYAEGVILNDTLTITSVLALEAIYAITADSLHLADSIYNILIEEYHYPFSAQDLGNYAYMMSCKGEADAADEFMSLSYSILSTSHDTLVYYANLMEVSRNLDRKDLVILYYDSLLSLYNRRYESLQQHAIMAEQRDYSELRLLSEKEVNYRTRILFVFAVVTIVLLICLLYVFAKKEEARIAVHAERIKALNMELSQHYSERLLALSQMKNTPIYADIFEKLGIMKGLSQDEWNTISHLFNQKLPYFVPSLKELFPISDTELHLCYLLKLGFSPKDIAILMNLAQSSVSTMRHRLYIKAFGKKGTTTEWDQFIAKL